MSAGTVHVPTAVDDRFARRSPFWRPGMSVMVEPWDVLGESTIGHLRLPGHRDPDQARRHLDRWEVMSRRGMPVTGDVLVVAASLVDPHGDVVASWALDGASAPEPGVAPRWAALTRISYPTPCPHCRDVRWPGAWLAADGCGDCLPDRERGDPRPSWPHDPARPPDLPAKPKAKPGKSKVDAVADEAVSSLADLARVDSPDPDRLF